MRVELRGATRRYGKARALDGVSLVVGEGERVALVGPNGSGKSTLLRAVMGLLACEGEVLLDGRPAFARDPATAARLAYVPQIAPALAVSVGEMVGAVSRLRGIAPACVEAMAEALALDVRAPALRRRAFRDLSGGMKQKLLLALALASGATLLVLDEPTASLDADSRRRLFAAFAALAPAPTLLLSSHRRDEVRRLADRVVALDGGRVVADRPAALALDALDEAPLDATASPGATPAGGVALVVLEGGRHG